MWFLEIRIAFVEYKKSFVEYKYLFWVYKRQENRKYFTKTDFQKFIYLLKYL